MSELFDLLWRPVVAIVLLIIDPLRTIAGVVLGLFARPWWVVLPGAVVLSGLLEIVYVKLLSHNGSFNSFLGGFFVCLIAAWTGLSWRGRAPQLTSRGTNRG
jgi:hypothetical protein